MVILTKKQIAAIKAKESEQKKSELLRSGKFVDTDVNTDGKPKNFKVWTVDMKTHKKIEGSETVVRSKHGVGQAVDDYMVVKNKGKKSGETIGYPVIQGTVEN